MKLENFEKARELMEKIDEFRDISHSIKNSFIVRILDTEYNVIAGTFSLKHESDFLDLSIKYKAKVLEIYDKKIKELEQELEQC